MRLLPTDFGKATAHPGGHVCACGYAWEPSAFVGGEFGCLTMESSEPKVIGEVPILMRISMERLLWFVRRGVFYSNGGFSFGRHVNGGLLYYVISTWDGVAGALIVVLDEPLYDSTRRPEGQRP